MRVAILGGGGIIGRALVETIADSVSEILVTTRSSPPPRDFSGRWVVGAQRARQFAELRHGAPWDIVVDLCAMQPSDLADVFDLASLPCKQWIHVSSVYVYRRLREAHALSPDQTFLPVPIPETMALTPAGIYGEGKRACEEMWVRAYRDFAAPVVVLRVPFVYGRFDRSRRVGFYLDHLATGTPLALPKLGAARIDLIHADELASALVRIVNVAPIGEVLNVVVRPARPLCDHIAALAAAVGTSPRIVPMHSGEEPPPFAYARDIVLDGQRLHKLVGEVPVAPLALTWASAVAWEQELRAAEALLDERRV